MRSLATPPAFRRDGKYCVNGFTLLSSLPSSRYLHAQTPSSPHTLPSSDDGAMHHFRLISFAPLFLLLARAAPPPDSSPLHRSRFSPTLAGDPTPPPALAPPALARTHTLPTQLRPHAARQPAQRRGGGAAARRRARRTPSWTRYKRDRFHQPPWRQAHEAMASLLGEDPAAHARAEVPARDGVGAHRGRAGGGGGSGGAGGEFEAGHAERGRAAGVGGAALYVPGEAEARQGACGGRSDGARSAEFRALGERRVRGRGSDGLRLGLEPSSIWSGCPRKDCIASVDGTVSHPFDIHRATEVPLRGPWRKSQRLGDNPVRCN